jgi:predicted regulator of amino acid metabolism with ACT domain
MGSLPINLGNGISIPPIDNKLVMATEPTIQSANTLEYFFTDISDKKKLENICETV